MVKPFQLNLLALLIGSSFLTGCGDAETTIVEQESIVEEDDHSDHDDEYTIESMGRLAVLSGESAEAHVYDLDDGDLLESFTLTSSSVALKASGGYRYAVLSNRDDSTVGFIDGGMWREDHGEHLHDYAETPAMSDYELTAGSQPTHVVTHDGEMAIFYDGDSEVGTSASVEVLTDTDITTESAELATVNFDINMHGVALPRGEHLLSSMRRDDSETTSAATILPDQVVVYHAHDGVYELEQTLEVLCPDLHGAAQNHEAVAFGCSDGVLVAHQHDDEYEAEKIDNIDELGDLRIGSVYGHEGSETLVGVASDHGGGESVVVALHVEDLEMEVIDWQAMEGASATSYAFAFGGSHFVILDDLGYLTILEQHEHDGHMEWEYAGRVDISEEDVADMPDGMSFTMTVAQNGDYVYVADPIAQHVLQVHVEDMEIEGDIELTFAPSSIAWVGIAEESDEEHDHDH